MMNAMPGIWEVVSGLGLQQQKQTTS